jgi:hypothetical protein
MAGPGETLGSPRPPHTVHGHPHTVRPRSKVATHTIIATVRNVQLTLKIVGLVAGSTAFFLQIHSQVRNQYLSIKVDSMRRGTLNG